MRADAIQTTHTLAVSPDGSQNTAYPAGDKDEPVLPPDSLTARNPTTTTVDLAWNYSGAGQTGFIYEQFVQGQSTVWEPQTPLAPTDRSHTAQGIPAGRHVGFRIRAEKNGALSAWSQEAWTDTLTGTETDLSRITWAPDWSAVPDGEGFWNNANGTTYGLAGCKFAKVSSVRMLGGKKSAREELVEDMKDSGGAIEGCGYVNYDFNGPYGEASEVWWRVWVYHEEGYDWSAGPGHRKTMRVGEIDADDNSNGFNDFLFLYPNDARGFAAGSFMHIREPLSRYVCTNPTGSDAFKTGVWQCLEVYCKRGDTDETGEIRVWVDGVPGETIATSTSVVPNGRFQRCMFINYWNAPVATPLTHSWVSPAFAVRNSERDDTVHMATDSNGHPFIGTVV